MTETTNEPVRLGYLVRQTLRVLADATEPLPRREVLRRVGEISELTEYERAAYRRDGNPEPRWENRIAWESVGLRDAGFMLKTRAGWVITEAGRQALAEADPAGSSLLEASNKAYHAKRPTARGSSGEGPDFGTVATAALELLEPGQWTTYGELATLAGTSAQVIGNFVTRSQAEGAHRVLSKGGRPAEGFTWADSGRTESQREALEAEGLEFDHNGNADEAAHVGIEDFREFLEDQGVLTVLPRRAWRVRVPSAFGYDLVPRWLAEGYVSLPATKLREVEEGVARSDLKAIVEDDYSHASYASRSAKVDEFHAFLSRMRAGDIVAVTSQGQLYLGTISSGAAYQKSPDGMSNLRRSVEWDEGRHDFGDLAPEISAKLQVQYDVVEMTAQLDLLEEMLDRRLNEEPAAPVHRQLVLPDSTDELAQRLNVDRSWLQECIELLRDRPQLIFYGPPGTGKTFIARHLAEHLAGENVRLTQFHPAYSYEDFFEGYRPVEEGGFALRPGPLRKTIDAAVENPSTPYFLIIDEINRGNLAKIFGELYFLLEYRSENVELLYASGNDVGFSMPENVFIIGTMNTADRSIALVDAAMRRRFAFVPLHPSEAPTAGVLRRWLEKEGHDVAVADLLDELNSRIEDPDFKIGPSYFMRKAVHAEGGLDRAWRTAILPLLEEHHYGDGTDVARRYGLEQIRARVAQRRKAPPVNDEPADPA